MANRLELLNRLGIIEESTLARVEQVRSARNQLVHRGTAPSGTDAKLALEGAILLSARLLGEKWGSRGLDDVLQIINERQPDSQQRPSLRTVKLDPEAVWLDLPPLPSDPHWDGRPFETIDEIRLRSIRPSKDKQKREERPKKQ